MSNEVDQIKAKLDVVDVIGEYVRLKQSGANWKGLCPFHREKSPSFMVHREKQIWHCFGCGEGGDIFSFLQKVENMDFPEALEILARKAGVTLERRVGGAAGESQRSRLFQAVELAAGFFRDQLTNSPQAERARAYIASREIIGDSVTTFGIGFSPPEWDKLLVFLRGKGFSLDEIIAAGLAIKSERGPGAYDRFRDRLMFPIADVQGRIVGFGGRTLPTGRQALDAEAKEAKYINSPQGATYNKSVILYNLDRAKNFIKEAGYAVLVEGYMDVVGSWQADVKNVVATSGTALTPEQVKIIKRYTTEIRLAFDADLAGQSASERGIDLALAVELEVKVIVLPFGKDPDDCAKQDAAAYRQAIEGALPIGDYAFQTVLKQVDVTTREGKKEAAKHLLTAIAKLPDPVERDHYVRRLAGEIQVDERALRERLASVAPRPAAPLDAEMPRQPAAPLDRHQLLSERLLMLLIRFGGEAATAFQDLLPEHVSDGAPATLYSRMLVYYTERQNLELDGLRQEVGQEAELATLLDHLFFQAERDLANLGTAEAKAELATIVAILKELSVQRELKHLSTVIREAQRQNQPEVEQQALQQIVELHKRLERLQS